MTIIRLGVVEKMRLAHERTLVMCLVETVKGHENVDAIAAVPGVDVCWLGHFDTTISWASRRWEHPRYTPPSNLVGMQPPRVHRGFLGQRRLGALPSRAGLPDVALRRLPTLLQESSPPACARCGRADWGQRWHSCRGNVAP
jgi:hypothetical protein